MKEKGKGMGGKPRFWGGYRDAHVYKTGGRGERATAFQIYFALVDNEIQIVLVYDLHTA